MFLSDLVTVVVIAEMNVLICLLFLNFLLCPLAAEETLVNAENLKAVTIEIFNFFVFCFQSYFEFILNFNFFFNFFFYWFG